MHCKRLPALRRLLRRMRKVGQPSTVVLRPDLPIGFLLILEPYETDNATTPNPIFHLVYVDLVLLNRATHGP